MLKRKVMASPIKFQIIVLLIIILQSRLMAQDLVSFSSSATMAHDHINCVYHDPDGYVWIGTRDGLSRFDGYTFNVYRNDPGDTTTIPNNSVQMITEDKSGGIWVVTTLGIARYQRKTNIFQRVYFHQDKRQTIFTNGDICFDNTGQGWLINRRELVSFNPELTAIRFIDVSDFYNESGNFVPDDHGLWVPSWKGLFHFSFQTLRTKARVTAEDADTCYRFSVEKNKSAKINFIHASTGVFVMIVNQENDFMELFVTDEKTHALVRILIPLSNDGSPLFQLIDCLDEIFPGKIFIGSDYKKAIILDIQDRTFKFDHPIQKVIGGKIRYHFYNDHQGITWIGGVDGLKRHTKPQLNYQAWLNTEGMHNSLSSHSITSVFKDKHNNLWVGSRDGGVDRIDLRDNSVENIKLPAELKKPAKTKNVFDITALNDEELLINVDTVIYRYNIARNKFSVFKTIDYHVYNIFRDSKENVWISSRRNILVGKSDDDYAHFHRIQFTDSVLTRINPRDLCEDHTGQVWLACSIGLVKLEAKNPDASRIFVPPGSESEPEVFCIHETKNGTLWLGTIRNGIYAFDPSTGKFTAHYSTKEGLIDNSVNAIYEDHRGHLWMSTWKGIARFDAKTGGLNNYGTVNGLPFAEFNTNADFMDKDGTIYFGGEGGVIAFHPDSFVNFETRAALGIGSITINNRLKELDYPLRDGKLVTLPHDQNSLVISFSSFDFRHPENRIYRYRLKGVQEDWKQTQRGDRKAEFTGLKPGEYVFEVQSTYNGWPWILDETSIRIIIESPPIYERTGFFITIAAIAILAIITVVVLGMRNFSIRKEMEISRLETEANQSNMNFLKSQMNPHFYFNTLNAINSFVLQNDARTANKFLAMFAKLMREILENSQNEFISVAEERAVLDKYLQLQQLRFPGIFDFIIEAEESAGEMKIPPMLLQPFVENSVEYAFPGNESKGLIRIVFRKRDGQLVCEVVDNGIGINKSQEIKMKTNRKSTALVNIAKRIEVLQKIYNVKIELNISPALSGNIGYPGTHITLKLPDFNQTKIV
jgi:ligand-binding sensor domain-containing protein